MHKFPYKKIIQATFPFIQKSVPQNRDTLFLISYFALKIVRTSSEYLILFEALYPH